MDISSGCHHNIYLHQIFIVATSSIIAMAHGKRQLENQPSPDKPVTAQDTVPPSPPLTSSSPSLSPLPRPLLQRDKARTPALPRSVAGAYRCLREAHRGQYAGPSWVRFFDVCPDDLEALISATESFKYRFDYEPSNQQLTLRMPEGSPHIFTKNVFAQSILRGVQERIHRAIQEEDARADTYLRSIKIMANVEDKVKFPNGGIKRPDVAFSFKGSYYPPLVVEIGHSQKAESLATDARDYIDKTEGTIHTVITARFVHLDADQRRQKRRQTRDQQLRVPGAAQPGQAAQRHTRSQTRQQNTADASTSTADPADPADAAAAPPPAKLAHISLYRLGRRVVHDQEFRDAQGRPRDGGLELNIADFVPWDEEDGEDGDRAAAARAELEQLTFTVPFGELCDALSWGEARQILEEQTPAPPDVPPVRAGKKRVHFEWPDPEPEPEADLTDTDTSEESARRSSSSKRRRISLDDSSYRAARSPRRQQGGVVAQGRRRSSSRLSQKQSQSPGRPGQQLVAHRRRRSSSRLSDDVHAAHTA